MAQGLLEKMRIIAYNDSHCEDSQKVGEFTALINPESYTIDHKLILTTEQAQNKSRPLPKYVYTSPEEMQFEFLFDSTGLLGNASPLDTAIGKADSFLGTGGLIGAAVDGIFGDKGVFEAVERFKNMLMNYHGESHEPNFFKLIWGKFIFQGRCSALSIVYRLFNPDGTPIRATCKASFKSFEEEKKAEEKDKPQSPDLTHYRIVKEGDTLPNMCYHIYGDARYYLEVARANGLSDFRKLHGGDELFFPPLAKTNT